MFKSYHSLKILLVAAFSFPNCSFAQSSESDYCKLIHEELGGEREVEVYAGRVDILTEELAIEVEWANKWKNSIGQSLWYGLQTNRKPGIILILRDKNDFKYLQQLNSALEFADLENVIDVKAWPYDFEESD